MTLRDARAAPAGAARARSGERRGTVGFLQGCVQRAYFGDVNAATVAVLAAEGFEVHAPRAPRCCGALGLHAGQEEDSLPLAKATIEAFERFDHVVVNAAGCGSAIKDYGHLLRDDPEWSERARGARRARARRPRAARERRRRARARDPVELKVAYHDACHLAHAQGVRAQPRQLLRTIPGLELVEPAEWELCCGSAGIYNLTRPEAAAELGARKADNLLATGAEAIAAANPGCTLQIAAHLQRKGRPLPLLHPMQLLAQSIEAGRRRRARGGPAVARRRPDPPAAAQAAVVARCDGAYATRSMSRRCRAGLQGQRRDRPRRGHARRPGAGRRRRARGRSRRSARCRRRGRGG